MYPQGMRVVLFILAVLASAACSQSETKVLKEEPLRQYDLRGEIVSLDAEGKVAKIKHEQIGDWMSPMTMDFPVKDPAEFARLKEGQQVAATVFVQGFGYWVGDFKDPSPPKQ
jgi:Cu/Ag efflux protein CusF